MTQCVPFHIADVQPQNLRLLKVTPTTVDIVWDRPTNNSHLVTGYSLHIWIIYTTGIATVAGTHHQWTGLRPRTGYGTWVRALTINGCGMDIAVKYFSTAPQGMLLLHKPLTYPKAISLPFHSRLTSMHCTLIHTHTHNTHGVTECEAPPTPNVLINRATARSMRLGLSGCTNLDSSYGDVKYVVRYSSSVAEGQVFMTQTSASSLELYSLRPETAYTFTAICVNYYHNQNRGTGISDSRTGRTESEGLFTKHTWGDS